MPLERTVAAVAAAIIFARLLAELWLSALNRRHARAHAAEIPPAFRDFIDEATYRKSVAYTLAKEKFGAVESVYDTAVLILFLFSGILPWAFHIFRHSLGDSAWVMAVFLFSVSLAMSVLSWPFEWAAQFRLEEKFGFNTTTQRVWWSDRVKGLLLAVILGCPFLILMLKMVSWAPSGWWFWDWAAAVAFQLVMTVLAPVLILPLFNKLTPLPPGSLRDRLLALAGQCRFHAQNIQVMDGSKRSRHSNAFFTGFGRFRKIVLFDTLVGQLSEPETTAVLAHEIGHYKKGHIPKMLVFSSFALLAAFYVISVLTRQEWFYRAFGFPPGNIAPAFLLFGLLAGAVTFWVSPLLHGWSRRYEYEADAFAARATGQTRDLIGALRKLNGENLSNLVPHPIYSGFYYSHPTLLERERALAKI